MWAKTAIFWLCLLCRIVTLVVQCPRSPQKCAKGAVPSCTTAVGCFVRQGARVLYRRHTPIASILLLLVLLLVLLSLPGMLQKAKRHGQASRTSPTKPWLAWGGWNPSNTCPHDASRGRMRHFCSRGSTMAAAVHTALRKCCHYDTIAERVLVVVHATSTLQYMF